MIIVQLTSLWYFFVPISAYVPEKCTNSAKFNLEDAQYPLTISVLGEIVENQPRSTVQIFDKIFDEEWDSANSVPLTVQILGDLQDLIEDEEVEWIPEECRFIGIEPSIDIDLEMSQKNLKRTEVIHSDCSSTLKAEEVAEEAKRSAEAATQNMSPCLSEDQQGNNGIGKGEVYGQTNGIFSFPSAPDNSGLNRASSKAQRQQNLDCIESKCNQVQTQPRTLMPKRLQKNPQITSSPAKIQSKQHRIVYQRACENWGSLMSLLLSLIMNPDTIRCEICCLKRN